VGELIQNRTNDADGSAFGDLTGRDIGRYHIQKRLGRGGLTTVYQAYDMVDDFPVAIKVLLHSADEKVYNRFRYEAQTAAKLHHPHIVRTLRVGVATGSETAYIAMELVEGEDLAAFLASRRRLTAEESCLLLTPIATALAYAHKRGIIHRDVKPSNILLRTVGMDAPNSLVLDSLDYPLVPLLSDFGIARALDVPELTHSGRTVGTPAFMAPEQCLGRRNIDHRADLYALGAVFYRCITGRQPFMGSTVQILHAHVYESITVEDEILRQLSQTHLHLLQRTLAKDPNERYQNAEEMAIDLAFGANPADLQMTAEQLEQNATVTLNIVALGKPPSSAGPSSVVVPASVDLATQPTATSTVHSTPSPTVSRTVPPTVPDVYYDRILDQRLRRISGIVLFVLIVLISLLLLFSFMDLSIGNLWQQFGRIWTPFASPVMALSDHANGSAPVVASGNGKIRRVSGVVWPISTPTLAPSVTASVIVSVESSGAGADPVAIAEPLPPPAATDLPPAAPPVDRPVDPMVESVTGHCTTLPADALSPYIAQLDSNFLAEFRCATGLAVGGYGELLLFDYGYMLYVYEMDKMFVVSTLDEQWEDIDLAWLDGDTIPPPGEADDPESGKFTPQQMFGKIWQNATIRRMLGEALMPTAARFPVIAQKFPGGWLVLDQERPDERYLFLRKQRRW